MTLDIEKSTAPLMWMERWLSEPRLRRYLDVCQGDSLVRWNCMSGISILAQCS